jgi:serine/threonine-protein kinase
MTSDTTNSSDPAYLLEEGMIINDKWKIQNFIAKGGKGEVYLAHQIRLDRQVALKIMSYDFLKSLEGDKEEISSETKRFNREVQVMARMQHPNILQVYDFDQLEMDDITMDYIVMEYVPGPTLRWEMPETGFGHDEKKVRNWLKKYFFPILDGMKAVHVKGVVHRDMKPENVLLDDGVPKIMDFGIAGGYHMDNVTQTHHMLGTLTYMPEEQFMDLALTDVRVDVYALGKIIYEVVEGKMKKGREKPFHSVALKEPKTMFFKTLDRIIQQATAKNRNQRTPSVNALHDSLKELVLDSEEKKHSQTNHMSPYWKSLFGMSAAVIILFFSAVVLHHNWEKLQTPSAGDYITKNLLERTNPTDTASALPEFGFTDPRPTSIPSIDQSKKPPASILSNDDMTMLLLEGAEMLLPIDEPMTSETKQDHTSIYVKTFYMDKTKVTNYLYVQFLNSVDGIEVKNKSVFRKGQLLMLLGEVREGYEPIIFQEGRFSAKSDDVTKPVVRVTPLGALSYANYYGKTLPLMGQWWFAATYGLDQNGAESPSSSQLQTQNWMMHGQSMEPRPLPDSQNNEIRPVTQTTANQAGIQGLGQNVNEWTMYLPPGGDLQFHIHGGVGELDNRDSYVERQPWEAFSRVGFRTVLNLNEKN